MADKEATSSQGTALATVATNGSITAGTVIAAWDDTDDPSLVIDQLEKCKLAILDDYADA